ncbi:MAG TPA: AraC family transcriptional regulator [Planctomycetota bacterium]|nr:AraC family transcriptional regulator [Planctomycetota bacterium]
MKEKLNIPDEYDGAVWLYKYSGPRIHHIHRHDELEVNLCTRGRAVYLVDDKRYDLRRGTQIWLFPEQDHLLLDRSTDYEMWILVWKERLLKQICTTPQSKPLLNTKAPPDFCKPLPEHQTARLNQLFQEVADSKPDLARWNCGLGYCALVAWAIHVADQRITPSFDIHPAVEKAARLLQHERTPNSLEELSRQAGLSPSRLSRLFKEQTGVSLVEYRNKQRLQRFFSLYQQGRRKNMTAAALEAGFGSYPQFHRIFKEQMGYGPAGYRRKVADQPTP